MKKPIKAEQYLSQKQKEEAAVDHFGEGESLHTVLRKLTDNYLLCQDCWKNERIPVSMSIEEFEP